MAVPWAASVERAAERGAVIPVDSAERVPWVAQGLAAGGLGACCVALFFLLVDSVMGRPFWTPHALGAALFLAQVPSTYARPETVLVLGYTAVHFTVFVGLAAPAAFWALGRLPSARGPGRATLLGVALFLVLEIVFVSLSELFAPSLLGMLSAGRVACANALAAAGMSSYLFARARRRRRGRRSGDAPGRSRGPRRDGMRLAPRAFGR